MHYTDPAAAAAASSAVLQRSRREQAYRQYECESRSSSSESAEGDDGEAVDVKPLVGVRKCIKVGVTGLNKETTGHRDEGGWLLGLGGRWASMGGICIPLQPWWNVSGIGCPRRRWGLL